MFEPSGISDPLRQNWEKIYFVPSAADIERFPLLNGERAWIMAMADSLIACKTGKPMGVDLVVCKMEQTELPRPPKPEEFVTKSDIEKMMTQLAAMLQNRSGGEMTIAADQKGD